MRQASRCPRPPRLLACLAALAVNLAACAWAAPVKQPNTPAPYATFAYVGTNPVVDAEEEHVVRVGLSRDTASLALARRWLDLGQWPPAGAIRPEDFTAALAAPPVLAGGPPRVQIATFPSPFREGWDVVTARVTTPATASQALARRVRVVLDSHVTGVDVPAFSAALASAAQARAPGLRLETERGPLVAALESALRAAAEAPLELVVISDGAGLGGPDGQRELLARIAAARPRLHVSVLGVLASGYDDALLQALTASGGGRYVLHAANAERPLAIELAASFARALEAAWLSVDFDPGVVARWRLVGHESSVPRGPERPPGRPLEVATTTFVCFEVKRLDAPSASSSLGTFALFDGPALVVQGALAALAKRDPEAERLYAASILAEKLRGSYWAQRIPWPAIAAALHDARLAPLAAAAQALEPTAHGAGLEPAVPRQHPLPVPPR